MKLLRLPSARSSASALGDSPSSRNQATTALVQDRSFHGLTALVTGASSGFGEAIATKLAREGARVILAARRQERVESLARRLGSAALALPLDVGDKDAVGAALQALPSDFASIDILVNNAGGAFGLDKAQEGKLSDWEAMVQVNVLGVLHVTHATLPGMIARGRGHILNIGSVAGTYPYVGGNVYGACKAFVKQLTLDLKADLLGTPIRVTNIEPGMAETEFSLVRFGGDAARARATYARTQPLTSEDIAECVCWCASLPPHVNINRIEVMPTRQGFAGFSVDRDP